MLDIKAEREKRGMTQDQFAELLGVSRKTIVNYESGGNIPETKEKIFTRILSNNTPKEIGVTEDESLYKLAYDCISRHDELMSLPEYRNHIEYIVNLKLNTFKNLDELKRYLEAEIN